MVLWLGFFIQVKHRVHSPPPLFATCSKTADLVVTHGASQKDGAIKFLLQCIPAFMCLKLESVSEMYHCYIHKVSNIGDGNDCRWRVAPVPFAASSFGIDNTLWIQILLENGIDRTAVDEHGRNALHLSFLVCDEHHHKCT